MRKMFNKEQRPGLHYVELRAREHSGTRVCVCVCMRVLAFNIPPLWEKPSAVLKAQGLFIVGSGLSGRLLLISMLVGEVI